MTGIAARYAKCDTLSAIRKIRDAKWISDDSKNRLDMYKKVPAIEMIAGTVLPMDLHCLYAYNSNFMRQPKLSDIRRDDLADVGYGNFRVVIAGVVVAGCHAAGYGLFA